MDLSNLFSGILGAGLGACASFLSVWLQLKKQAGLATHERYIMHTDSALTALHSIQHKIPYLPRVNEPAFGYKNENEVQAHRATLRAELASLKTFCYLLPQDIRVHWDEWLLCLSDLSVSRTWDDVMYNRAITDVDAFTEFTVRALDAFRSGQRIHTPLERPFLLRNSTDKWDIATGKALNRR